jgi:hypothetical protein
LARKALLDTSPLVRKRALERLRYKSSPGIDLIKQKLRNDKDPGVRQLADSLLNDNN